MSKIAAMRNALSASALAALGYVRSDRIGAVVSLADRDVMTELRKVGVVGENDGLTIMGSALVARIQEETMNALF